MSQMTPTQSPPPSRLFIPGPIDVPADASEAQRLPMIGHRSREMDDLFGRVQTALRQVFRTDSRVYLLASSGSGLHEAAIRNCVRGAETDARVLCLVGGAFGDRWLDVARGCGRRALKLEIPWFQAFQPEEVQRAVVEAQRGGPVDAVCVIHNETSTGILNPVAEIAEAVRAVSPDTLILVDAVSSIAGAEVQCDDWGLDVCLTSSQKALAVPPGLALAAVSDRALERAERVAGRGWYFDFLNLEKYLLRGTTPATPAISLVRALEVQLTRILAEGLPNRWARHLTMRDHVLSVAPDLGMRPCADAAYRSPTVTTLSIPPGLAVPDLNAHLGHLDMEVGDGYGDQKGASFRVAHMGEMRIQDLDRLFGAIKVYLT